MQLDIQSFDKRNSENRSKISGDIAVAIAMLHVFMDQQEQAVFDEVTYLAGPIRDKIERVLKNFDVGR